MDLFNPQATAILKNVLTDEEDDYNDELAKRIKRQSQYRELSELEKRNIGIKLQSERLMLLVKINENIEKDKKRLEEFEQKHGKTGGMPIRIPIRNSYGEIMSGRELRQKGLM